MKVALVLTRNPFFEASGRTQVLKTVMRSYLALGHAITAYVFDAESEVPPEFRNISFVWLGRPRKSELLWAVIRSLVYRQSLNSQIYKSNRIDKFLAKQSDLHDFDIWYFDMVRTESYAKNTTGKKIVDLDDLLSARYRAASMKRQDANYLGYFGSGVPRFVSGIFRYFSRFVLIREFYLLREEEREICRRSDLVVLVNEEEASKLAAKSRCNVESMPMSVPINPVSLGSYSSGEIKLMFLGGLDYQPNLEALQFFSKQILPACRAMDGFPKIKLTVVGRAPSQLQALVGDDEIEYKGFVDDLYTEFSLHNVFVAPIVSGTGLKTKVLEAMGAGMPVLATSFAMSGVGAINGVHYLEFNTPNEFFNLVKEIAEDGVDLGLISSEGCKLVSSKYSADKVASKWGSLLEELI